MDEAIDVPRSKQQPDGALAACEHASGGFHFALGPGDSRLSRWHPLRALRVLDWYHQTT